MHGLDGTWIRWEEEGKNCFRNEGIGKREFATEEELMYGRGICKNSLMQ